MVCKTFYFSVEIAIFLWKLRVGLFQFCFFCSLSRLRKDKTELEKQKTNLTTELVKLKQLIEGTQDVSVDQLAKVNIYI